MSEDRCRICGATPEPTPIQIVEEMKREFPMCSVTIAELAFLNALVEARRSGVGFGWMRQAIGIAWRLKDPRGYMDDSRIIEMYAPKKKTRKKKAR